MAGRKPCWQDPFCMRNGMPDWHKENRKSADDINSVNRTLIAGAVTIGTLGLIGSLFRR